jgi:cytochrome P450
MSDIAMEKSGTKHCPVDFDHYTSAFAEDPWSIYDELRSTAPIAWSDKQEGFWVVTSHELIGAISRDHEHFSTRHVSIPKGQFGDDLIVLPPMTLDPPEHTAVRKLLLPAFVPQHINKYEDDVREFCRSLIADFKERGECDASYEYARRVPIYMISRMLGVPREREESFTGWIKALVETGVALDPDGAFVAAAEFLGFITDEIAKRREQPTDDLISVLLETETDGVRISETDLVGSIFFMIVAGIDTTWSTVSEALLYLAGHPEDRHRLAGQLDLVPTAVEEFLRLYAPATVGRVVIKDTTLGGMDLKEGDSVLLAFAAGCRDPEVFADPAEAMLDRPNNNHIAFGTGTHKCLGERVARLELRVGLEEFLKAFPDFEVSDPGGVVWAAGHIHGPRHLPLRLS